MVRRVVDAARHAVGGGGQTRAMRSAMRRLANSGVVPQTVADVGASDGNWSRMARKVFPAAELVLFEPQPVHSPALDRFQIDYPEAKLVRSAVGGSAGTSPFDAADPWGGVLEPQGSASSIMVQVVTLDEALADASSPFLVKLDTHGVEADVLAGAGQTLTRSVAWVIEAYNQQIAPTCLLFWELCARMAEHGFRPIDLVDVLRRPYDGSLWQMDLFFVRSDWTGFSHLGYR